MNARIREVGGGWIGLGHLYMDLDKLCPSPFHTHPHPTNNTNKQKQAFDLRDNMAEIFSLRHRPGDFSCLDGMRAISCGWVVLYHVLLWQVSITYV